MSLALFLIRERRLIPAEAGQSFRAA